MSNRNNLIAKLRDVLSQEPGLEFAMLYGSVAAGKERQDSDVDIAVCFETPLDFNRKADLVLRLEAAIARSIDLADIASLNGTILKQVLTKGCVIVERKLGSREKQNSRMLYNQADMMPYVRRTLKERQRRFLDG